MPSRSLAQEALPVALHWVRGEGASTCIDGAQLSRSLDERLGHRVFSSPTDAEYAVEGMVTQSAEGGYAAHLSLVQRDGTVVGSRELSSSATDCGELSETVIVVLAVMVNPESSAIVPAPKPAPEPEPPPAPPEPPSAPVRREPQDALGVMARLVTHTLPSPVVGFGLDYARDLPRRIRLRLAALAFTPSENAMQLEGAQRGAEFQLLTLSAAACPSIVEGRGFGLSLCGGLQGGLILYRSLDATQPDKGTLGLVQVSAGARAWWQNRRLRVSVGSAAVAALVRHDLVIKVNGSDDVSILNQPTFSADVDCSVAVRF